MATGWLRLTVTMKFKSTTCWSERWFYNQVALFIVDRGWWFTVMILPFIFQTHCTVPIYSSAVSAMAFHPTTNCLFMVHADQQVISVFSFVPFHSLFYSKCDEKLYWLLCFVCSLLNTDVWVFHRAKTVHRLEQIGAEEQASSYMAGERHTGHQCDVWPQKSIPCHPAWHVHALCYW